MIAAATEDFGRRVQELHADTEVAVAAIAEITEIVAQIDSSQGLIAAAVEEQTATTITISDHATRAATGTQSIAHEAAGVAAGAEAESHGIADISDAAGDLSRMASRLRILINHFRY